MTILIIVGLLGLIFGSFLNAYTFRLISGESAWRGRSHCPHCHKTLEARDLIPLFSFLLLRGRCRYCRKPISWQYPLVEAATALLFVGAGLFAGTPSGELSYLVPLVFYLYFVLVAVALVIVDIRVKLIPDRVILPAMIGAALLHLVQVWFGTTELGSCWVFLAAAFGGGGGLYLVAVISERIARRETMGGGDIKLTFLIGLLVGWPGLLVALLVAFWAGAIVGVCLLAFGSRRLADQIPFGPFLVLGAAVALVWGDALVRFFFPSL
jgi:prepilin signal peptidase PulO-like enzyme (type II secretory pathway)